MNFEPRYYQNESVLAVSQAIRRDKNSCPLIVLPTGSGKSYVIALLIKAMMKSGRSALVATHVKDLVDQNAKEAMTLLPFADIGVFSSGLKRWDYGHQFMFVGIQSYVNAAHEFPRHDYIIIDEAHLVPPDGEGRYQTVIKAEREKNPNIRIMGLCAYPYRLDQGPLINNGIFTEIAYTAEYLELVRQGFLAPITSKGSMGHTPNMTGVAKSGGDYSPTEMTNRYTPLIDDHSSLIVNDFKTRKCGLIFASSVEHAHDLYDSLRGKLEIKVVTGDTLNREKIIQELRHHDIQAIVNVNVMTVGTNVPGVDVITLARSTASAVLLGQMVGRGTRLAPGKKDCLVRDLGGNFARLGPFDLLSQDPAKGGAAPMKECECGALLPVSKGVCDVCGFEFPKAVRKVGANLTAAPDGASIVSVEPSTRYIENVSFEFERREKGDCIIVKFFEFRASHPCQRLWLYPNHHSPFVRNKAWTFLSGLLLPAGEEGKEGLNQLKQLTPKEIANVLVEAYADRTIKKVTSIQTLPQKENPKYTELVGWETED